MKKKTLTKNAIERLNLIMNNLQTLTYNEKNYQALKVEDYMTITKNDSYPSSASQLSQPSINQYFGFMTKAKLVDRDNDKTFIYLRDKVTIDMIKKDIEEQKKKNAKSNN